MSSDSLRSDSSSTRDVTIIVLVVVVLLMLICIMIWYLRRCRRRPRYDYSALEDEALLHDRLEMDRKFHRDISRNMAAINCQYYLRETQRYIFIRQLANMGGRIDKHWFLVRDTATKTERLLTMTAVAENCEMRYNAAIQPVLLELFLALQHPYIYPVLDIDKKFISEKEYVISVIPYNECGTLKDLIHHSHCQDDWGRKYRNQGCGLPQSQIQRLGCQVLEALIFLRDQRFPPFVHLHSGNVILQNGVARLSGLENVLLGYSSCCSSVIPRKVYCDKESAEIICFGHLIYEMSTGNELNVFHPSDKNYSELEHYPQVINVLKFIFDQGKHKYPSLRQVAGLEFFRHIDLRELQSHMPTPVFRGNVSQRAKSLLKEIRRSQRPKKKNKRSQSMSTIETVSVDSRESLESNSQYVKKKKKRALSSSETTPDQLCTQLQTLPLSDIEASTSVPSESRQNQDTKRPEDSKQLSAHDMLLQEIRLGFRLKNSQNLHIDV